MYCKVTHNIEITAQPKYLKTDFNGSTKVFIYNYDIKIKNFNSFSVQLLHRHWIIEEEDGKLNEVKGPGVVGLQPVIHGGDSFEYSSYSVLTCKNGNMQGKYLMKSLSNEEFEVEIPKFNLTFPVRVAPAQPVLLSN